MGSSSLCRLVTANSGSDKKSAHMFEVDNKDGYYDNILDVSHKLTVDDFLLSHLSILASLCTKHMKHSFYHPLQLHATSTEPFLTTVSSLASGFLIQSLLTSTYPIQNMCFVHPVYLILKNWTT